MNDETQLAVLGEKYNRVLTITDRMSTTIDKFADISAELQKGVAVNNMRIETQITQIKEIDKIVEEHNTEFHRVMDSFHSDLTTKIDSTETRIMGAIDDLKTGFSIQHIDSNKRLGVLENWRYMVLGMGLLSGGFLWYFVPVLLGKLRG